MNQEYSGNLPGRVTGSTITVLYNSHLVPQQQISPHPCVYGTIMNKMLVSFVNELIRDRTKYNVVINAIKGHGLEK